MQWLLGRVIASESRYAAYARECDEWMRRPFRLPEAGLTIVDTELRESALFGRRLLVVIVEDRDVESRNVDAFTMDKHWSGRPPAAFVRRSDRTLTSDVFRSILEHEYVHVNQALRGEFCFGKTAESIFRSRLALEFPAYALQHAFVPSHPTELTVHENALCCAQESALYLLVRWMVEMNSSRRTIKRVCDRLSASAAVTLRTLGVDEDEIAWLHRPDCFWDAVQSVVADVAARNPDNRVLFDLMQVVSKHQRAAR